MIGMQEKEDISGMRGIGRKVRSSANLVMPGSDSRDGVSFQPLTPMTNSYIVEYPKVTRTLFSLYKHFSRENEI